MFKTHILGKGIIVSTDAEVNKVVLQNNGDVFIPCYPKSITELFGKNSILQMNGPVHRRVHGLIGSFLKSAQLKARITRDIEASVRHFLSTWLEKQHCVYVQDEAKKVSLSHSQILLHMHAFILYLLVLHYHLYYQFEPTTINVTTFGHLI